VATFTDSPASSRHRENCYLESPSRAHVEEGVILRRPPLAPELPCHSATPRRTQ